MDTANLSRSVKQFIGANNHTILTGVGVTGTITTAFLTGRAAVKADRLLFEEREERLKLSRPLPLTRREEIKIVWTEFIPPVGVGATTIACIVAANTVSSKKTAAMAAAYGLSERAFSEYKEKVLEKMGENRERSMRDEIAQDRVNRDPVNKREVIIVGKGEVLCYDAISGRYFQSDVETLRKAMNKTNYDIINHQYASLSSFYDEIGLDPTAFSDSVGWNSDCLLELQLSTTMSSDDRPCIVMDFEVGPKEYYDKLW